MPIDINQELINELINREMDKQAIEKRFAPRSPDPPIRPTELSPGLAALIGAVADSASTYNFLKKGIGRENNSMYSGFGNKPAPTALAALGVGLGTAGISKLLGTPEGGLGRAGPTISRILLALQGANQLGYAGENLDGLEESSSKTLNRGLTREITRKR